MAIESIKNDLLDGSYMLTNTVEKNIGHVSSSHDCAVNRLRLIFYLEANMVGV